MDERHLKAFIAVFEERNITQAAQRLHVTQPTLSLTIKQLESLLATPLFIRQARGVAITEAAESFYPRAKAIVNELAELTAQFRDRRKCTPLTIAIDEDFPARGLQQMLSRLQQHHPEVLLTLQQASKARASVAALILGIADNPLAGALFYSCWQEPFQLALASDHPLLQQPITAERLANYEWVFCPSQHAHQQWRQSYLATDAIAAYVDNYWQARQIVATSYAMAILPQSLINAEQGVVAANWPIALAARQIGLYYTQHALQKPTLAAIFNTLTVEPYLPLISVITK